MHDVEEQLDEGVGNFAAPRVAQRGQQSQAHLRRPGPQIGGVLLSRPGPPRRDEGVGGAGEQVHRQLQSADPLELVDLAEQGFQARPARVGLEFGEQPPLGRPHRCGVALSHQSFEAVDGGGVQPGHGRSAEPVGRGSPCLGDQPIQTTWGFESLAAAAEKQPFAQPLVGRLKRGEFGGQPVGEGFLVGARHGAETQRVADLRPVVLDGAPGPRVPAEQARSTCTWLAT